MQQFVNNLVSSWLRENLSSKTPPTYLNILSDITEEPFVLAEIKAELQMPPELPYGKTKVKYKPYSLCTKNKDVTCRKSILCSCDDCTSQMKEGLTPEKTFFEQRRTDNQSKKEQSKKKKRRK